MSEFNQARREGKVKFGYDFSALAEVTHLWGLSATKLPYHNYFYIPGRENAICSLLSEKGGDGWSNIPHQGPKEDARGWREIVRIDEVNSDPKKSVERVENECEKPLERYVFWRVRRDGKSWYKFCGVFKLDEAETMASRAAGKNVCVYKKVSDEGECPKCEVAVRSISDAEFKSAEGKVLEANFLGTIAYTVADKKRQVGDIKVWPGQKFRITGMTPSALTAVCMTVDDEFLSQADCSSEICFNIPKRDIELGYFSILDKGLPAAVTLNLCASAHEAVFF